MLTWLTFGALAQQPVAAKASNLNDTEAVSTSATLAPSTVVSLQPVALQLRRTEAIFDVAVSTSAVLAVGQRGLMVIADPTVRLWRRIAGDAAQNWTAVTDLDDGGFLVAGTAGALLKVSADGVTTPMERIRTNSNILALVKIGSTLYAAGEFGALFVSSDDGRHWQPIDLPWGKYLKEAWRELGQTKPHLFGICASETGAEVFVVGEYGLVLSRRDGQWHQMAGGKVQPAIFACMYHKGRLYVAGQRGTFMMTSDHGKTWTNLGFTDVDLYALAALDQGLAVAGDGGSVATCASACVKREPPSAASWFVRLVRVRKNEQRLLIAGSTLFELVIQ
jgi:photosystem II stability/assembly factor-like uncharacterized protein